MGRFQDFSDGFEERQKRRRTLPEWFAWCHLLIFAASTLASFLGLFWLLIALHSVVHPGTNLFIDASTNAQKFIFIPVLFGMWGPVFAICNFLEWAIKPMRDTWDRHFKDVPGASLGDAISVTYWLLAVTVVCLAVSAIGIWDPWKN